MIFPDIIADLETAQKHLRDVIDSLPDEFRRRKIEAARIKILVSIDQLKEMTPGDLGN